MIPFEPLWEQYHRIIKDNGVIALFGTEPFSSKMRMSNLNEYKYDWVWVKEHGTGFANSHKQPMRMTENISIFYKQQPYYDYVGEKRDKVVKYSLPVIRSEANFSCSTEGYNLNNGERIYRSYEYYTKNNLLKFARKTKGCLHPTQKPVELLEYLIKTYTKEGELILDNCMGSGSTGVACVNTNRDFVGIELTDKYFEIAKERIESCENN